MARAVWCRAKEKPPAVDPDATEQLERPPADAYIAPATPVARRRQVDRWSTVFTVFAAVALVALLLLDLFSAAGGAVGQPVAVTFIQLISLDVPHPRSANGDPKSDRGSAEPEPEPYACADSNVPAHAGADGLALSARHPSADSDLVSGGGSRSADPARPRRRPSC
jgi:hypothetical protein